MNLAGTFLVLSRFVAMWMETRPYSVTWDSVSTSLLWRRPILSSLWEGARWSLPPALHPFTCRWF